MSSQMVTDAMVGVDGTAVMGMIGGVTELEDMITVRQAQELAAERGIELTRQYISRSAKNGHIQDSKLVGDTRRIWLIGRQAFVQWLENRNAPGRPREND